MERALALPGDSVNGCVVHDPGPVPSATTSRNWWYRRLLQHTPTLLAEMAGKSIILFYKDLAIMLSRDSVKDLHRNFLTCVGVKIFDLVSEVSAVIAFRRSTHRFLSCNPLTAAFMNTPQARVGLNTIPGKIAFRQYLDASLADLLQGTSAEIVRAIMHRTVNQPSQPFRPQDAVVGTYMVDAIRSAPEWATWQSCCQLHPWFVRQATPGSRYPSIAHLTTSTGAATDGTSYYVVPDRSELLEIVTRLRSGLTAGLQQHPLAALRQHVYPQWAQVEPRAKLFPKWHHPQWVQYLHPDIRVTATLTFCYRDAYVTLDPWAVDVCHNMAPASVNLTTWLEQHLSLRDVGFTSDGDTSVDDPLQHLGFPRNIDTIQQLA
jgi:hypothetical protein